MGKSIFNDDKNHFLHFILLKSLSIVAKNEVAKKKTSTFLNVLCGYDEIELNLQCQIYHILRTENANFSELHVKL